MRLVHPAHIVLPMMLVIAGVLLMTGWLDLVQVSQFRHFWPVSLIAVGMEELYLWARSGEEK
jgi:hypothetical protein